MHLICVSYDRGCAQNGVKMNLQMIVTYIGVDFFCAVIAITMKLCIQSDFGSEFEVKSLHKALDAYVGFLVLGLVWLLTQNRIIPFVLIVAWLANALSLICMTLTSYYWFMFAMARIRRAGKRPSKLQYTICQLPIALTIILCLTTQFTGLVFQITDSGEYGRGPLFVFVSVLQYLYSIDVCLYAIWYGIREKSKEKQTLYWLFGLFILFPMLAGIVQIMVGNTPIMAPAIITALFIIFVYVQKSQINSDSLTGLNNRKRLFTMLEGRMLQQEDHPLTVYMLDVNSFKLINDNYGHAEGDHALMAVAESLMILARDYHVFVSRYGGDEFTIVDYGEISNEPEKIVESFCKLLKMKCEEKELPYLVTASVGYSIWDKKTRDPEELIAQADQALYREKARIRAER